MNFSESRTYNNLQKAMDDEMRAFARYKIYAEKADEEKLRPVAKIFRELSNNEKEHSVLWRGILTEGNTADTLSNLESAAEGEQYEWTKMYEEYANIAAEEGYSDIADMFRRVALIEHHHDITLRSLITELKGDGLFCRESEMIWKCSNCGYLFYGKCAPEKCPVCGYPKEYYEILQEEKNTV